MLSFNQIQSDGHINMVPLGFQLATQFRVSGVPRRATAYSLAILQLIITVEIMVKVIIMKMAKFMMGTLRHMIHELLHLFVCLLFTSLAE